MSQERPQKIEKTEGLPTKFIGSTADMMRFFATSMLKTKKDIPRSIVSAFAGNDAMILRPKDIVADASRSSREVKFIETNIESLGKAAAGSADLLKQKGNFESDLADLKAKGQELGEQSKGLMQEYEKLKTQHYDLFNQFVKSKGTKAEISQLKSEINTRMTKSIVTFNEKASSYVNEKQKYQSDLSALQTKTNNAIPEKFKSAAQASRQKKV